MAFNFMYWNPLSDRYFLAGSLFEKYGKTAAFLGSYGRIGEIPHGRLRPDRGLKG